MHEDISSIAPFHVKFLKRPLKLNKNAANIAVYGEVGRFKLKIN